MPEPYTYTLLRYRHDPLAGEQVNVGVVIWAPKSRYLGASINRNFGRISKLFPTMNGRLLKKDLAKLQKSFDKLKKYELSQLPFEQLDAMGIAKKVLAPDDNSLVWSEMGSGISMDPQFELEKLLNRFVLQYETEFSSKRTDSDVWKPFREKLVEKNLIAEFQKKTIRTDLDDVEFDYSYKNGKWHCFQPLSFDLSSEEGIQKKAARWAGHMVGLKNSSEEFQTYFLVGKPKNLKHVQTYERGLNLLQSSPSRPRVVLEENFEDFSNELVDVFLGSASG